MHKIRQLFYIIVFTSLTTVFIAGASKDEMLRQVRAACIGETGATDEMIANANRGNFAEDESFKCYIKCIFEKFNVMTPDGKVNVEAVLGVTSPDLLPQWEPIIRGCTEVGANPCETAWLVDKCYYNGRPDLFSLP